VAFFVVYIREIHPSDGWQVPNNEKDAVLVTQPRDLPERVAVGQTCMLKLGLELPALVDDMDDRVATDYAGMPERLYLIGLDGCVAYKGAMGPMGFDPEEWEEAIAAAIE